jgi:DNA-binding NtrC family response regulator
VATTNADLLEAMREKRFREDLFFCLRVIPIEVPPLRERPEDIRPILSSYVALYAETHSLPRITFTLAAMERVRTYSWPGCVRELENCFGYLTCLQSAGPGRRERPAAVGRWGDHRRAKRRQSTKGVLRADAEAWGEGELLRHVRPVRHKLVIIRWAGSGGAVETPPWLGVSTSSANGSLSSEHCQAIPE